MSRPAMPGFQLPPAAIDWLIGPTPQRVLTLSGSSLPRLLQRAGHAVWAIDKAPHIARSLATTGRVTAVAAQAESLPFDPCVFDVVASHQVFHLYAPGLVLSEMARVLRPGGRAAASYLVRDDSVPWVRRLVALVQSVDPDAMAGAYGADALDELRHSKYFPTFQQRSFRHWVPATRDGVLGMVGGLAVVQGMAEAERGAFLAEVGALYDDAAPGADDLQLPYTLLCVRAEVDHAELTAPIEVDDDGLVIPL
ncbi:class I SAM-dependent methyltransferase [Propionibacteriaceae bacterium G1746]|uniref:class I SAM-dependent methyltransferase n=1 Tax=Aestuariimicrobium sp. G57 TaxID=3418485 RepID=UPI003C1897CC